MRLACLQCQGAAGDAVAALARVEEALATAASAGCALLVTPEMMVPGYNCPDAIRDAAMSVAALQDRVAPILAKAPCAIVIGWAEREGDAVYNAATAFAPDGRVLAHHRKRLLFGEMERAVFARGTGAPCTFDHGGLRFGMAICYEIEFPEIARGLARRGAEVVLVPTANPAGYEHVQRVLVPARAHEGRAFVAYVNYCGTENGLAFGGGTLLAGPDADTLVRAGSHPALLICDVPTLDSYPAGHLSTQLADLEEAGS